MEQRTKKILAREFLFFTLTLSITILSFLSSLAYNYILNMQIAKLMDTIKITSIVSDSLSYRYKLINENQQYFFSELKNNYGDFYKDKEELFSRLLDLANKDSIRIKWDKVWDKELINLHKSLGFSTPESFTDFINQNTLNENDIKHYNESISLTKMIEDQKNDEIRLKNKVLTLRNQINIGLQAFIITVLVLFFGRYMIYGIHWSIKTLKEKS